MSNDKPWSPTLENAKEFSELANKAHGNVPPSSSPPVKVPPPPEEDTAPLRGSKDVSDPDSLEDVIADTYDLGKVKTQPGASKR